MVRRAAETRTEARTVTLNAYRAVWSARDNGRLPGGPALFVALAMADWTNADGEVRAGIRRLAERTGLGRSTVQRATRAVVGAGLYAEVVTGRGRRATAYRLALSPRVAKLGDDNGVASHGEYAIASHENAVASQTTPRSVPNGDAYKEDTYTYAGSVPHRVAELRAQLRPEP
jgi:hypothetical protein